MANGTATKARTEPKAEAPRRFCKVRTCIGQPTGRLTRGDDLWDFCDPHIDQILKNLVNVPT